MYAKDVLQARLKPFDPGDGREDRSAAALSIQTIVLLVSLFGCAFCVTNLYLAMRGIMRLGGMVASGGPYAIAHPAPGWAWLLPGSMLAGVVFIGLNAFASRRAGGFKAIILAWPALFLSMGWNFLEFAFKGGGGQGIVWGWLVCGVVFIPMGAIPLFFILPNAARDLRGGSKARTNSPWPGKEGQGPRDSRLGPGRARGVVLILLQLGACGLGIVGSARFVHMLTGAKTEAVDDRAGAAKTSLPSPAAQQSSSSGRTAQPSTAHAPRLVITYEHNTLEIQSGEDRVFYNGRAYDRSGELPRDARRVLEQSAEMLRELLKY